MSNKLPPSPVGSPPGSGYWNDWYEKLRTLVNGTGLAVLWANIDFTGSNITSILVRLHNTLQGIQGGTVGEYNHLTNAQLAVISGMTKTTGSPTIPNSTATTIFTIPAGPAVYQITVNKGATNDSYSWGVYAIVVCDASTARFALLNGGALNQLSLLGMALQVTQSSGASAVINYSITKIG